MGAGLLFITFEGIEGCGKSTQVGHLSRYLKDRGVPHVATFEPGATAPGLAIRRILLDAQNQHLTPLSELMLYIADRAQHMKEVIEPALNDGKWVLCDRFCDATVAYQGVARQQDLEFIRLLNEMATQGLRPHKTILLDCPVEVGLKRALGRDASAPLEGQDRFEREAKDFHRAVRQAYLDLAQDDADRFIIIDAALTEENVAEKIRGSLHPWLPGR
jgi:dTMP kinase